LVHCDIGSPIQTGIEQDDDTNAVLNLAECIESELHSSGIRLPKAGCTVSGSRTLRHSGLSRRDIVRYVSSEPEDLRWIAEGAGGVLVPLNESESIIDLIATLGLPVLNRSKILTRHHQSHFADD
jgi:dethiobiotin synthetase